MEPIDIAKVESLLACAADSISRADGSLEMRGYAAEQVGRAIRYLEQARGALLGPATLYEAREGGVS